MLTLLADSDSFSENKIHWVMLDSLSQILIVTIAFSALRVRNGNCNFCGATVGKLAHLTRGNLARQLA